VYARRPYLPLARGLCLLVGLGLWTSTKLTAADLLQVELKSGRIYEAEMDARTSDERLWLRFGSPGAYLWRGVSWEHVARAERDGKALSAEELRRLAPEIATKMPERVPAKTMHVEREKTVAHEARVSSVGFDAYLANWDGDVEADGLVVRLMPIDDNGQIAPAEGTLDVDLVVVRRRDFSALPDGRGRSFDRIGRWTVAVSAADIGASGVTIRLPFQAVHPELDTTTSPYGLVHLRYSAAGHGVFEASQDVVRIRPFAPLRDQREQSGQSRFLEIERLGR
jgi:hypothetical protein